MHKAVKLTDDELLLLSDEVDSVIRTTPAKIRAQLADLVRLNRRLFVTHFYDVIATNPRSKDFITAENWDARLRGEMENWLTELFSPVAQSGEAIRRRQLDVGSVHARMKVPISMMMRGFRELKGVIVHEIMGSRVSAEHLSYAITLVSTLLDTSLAVITAAYARHVEKSVRSEETLRLYALGHDLLTERERQRAALFAWSQGVFFDAMLTEGHRRLQPLSRSDFGLWFFHRADVIFGASSEYESIVDSIDYCDELIATLAQDHNVDRVATLYSIKLEVDKIVSLLTMLFEGAISLSGARDNVATLLSRQLLPTALAREIRHSQGGKPPFCLIAFEFEQAKAVGLDREEWEEVVRRASQTILSQLRSSDMAFRYSDNIIMVLFMEGTMEAAGAFASDVVGRLTSAHFTVGDNHIFDLAVRHAATRYDREDDPRKLIRNVELALQSAAK